MQRATVILGLRVVWLVLMAILLVLVLTQSIGGFAMVLYSLVVLAVGGAEGLLKRKTHQH